MTQERLQKIEDILRQRFEPLFLEVLDDSGRHRGHAGAQGGGHFRVGLVSEAFEGKSLLERHRMVQESLKGLFGAEIHALQMSLRSPGEEA